MSTENDGAGGANSGNAGGEKEKNSVSYETYLKTVDQEKAWKKKFDEVNSKLAEIEADKKAAEEKKLEEDGNWRKTIELKNEKINELTGQLNDFQNKFSETQKNLLDSAKIQAVLDKLPGKVKRSEYLNFIDTEGIIVDPDSGEFDSSSLEKVANDYISNYGDLIARSDKGDLPNDAAGGGTQTSITYDEWLKLPLKEKNKMQKYVKD